MTETYTGLGSESRNRACTSIRRAAGIGQENRRRAEWSWQVSPPQRAYPSRGHARRVPWRRQQQRALDRRRASRRGSSCSPFIRAVIAGGGRGSSVGAAWLDWLARPPAGARPRVVVDACGRTRRSGWVVVHAAMPLPAGSRACGALWPGSSCQKRSLRGDVSLHARGRARASQNGIASCMLDVPTNRDDHHRRIVFVSSGA
jgi:hypothetical protein